MRKEHPNVIIREDHLIQVDRRHNVPPARRRHDSRCRRSGPSISLLVRSGPSISLLVRSGDSISDESNSGVNYGVLSTLRLPPPLLSREDWRSAQRLQGGSSVVGGIGDRRKANKDESNGPSRSSYSIPPSFSGKKEGMEAEMDNVQSSADWGRDGLIGLPGIGLGNKQKSLVEIFQLPEELVSAPRAVKQFISWSGLDYYQKEIASMWSRHKIIRASKSDSRLANNNLPPDTQKLRCRACYEALRFSPKIEAMGKLLVDRMRNYGRYIALHLRYEKDMLAFSGCTYSLSPEEADELTMIR